MCGFDGPDEVTGVDLLDRRLRDVVGFDTTLYEIGRFHGSNVEEVVVFGGVGQKKQVIAVSLGASSYPNKVYVCFSVKLGATSDKIVVV